jgi:CRISP-associated protein Cas1
MLDLKEQLLSISNFQLAWEHVAENHGCAGTDGETIGYLTHYLPEAIAQLRKTLKNASYRPLPLRQLYIPKEDGNWRSLAVPTVRDRIVQQALLNVLHPVMEPEFASCSFAYRPGRSHLMAVQQVLLWRDRGYEWVLDADIVKYFDRVQHQRLLSEVEERLPKGENKSRQDGDINAFILSLIEAWMSVGVLTKAGLVLPVQGLPQGSVVSPLLANIYLDDFDEAIAATGLKLVRYADDFLVMSRSRSRLVEVTAYVKDMLGSMGLQLHPDKTQITNFDRGFRFLGHAFTGDLVIPAKKPALPKDRVINPASDLRIVHADVVTQPTAMQLAMVEALKRSQQPIPPPLFVVLGYAVRSDAPISIDSHEFLWQKGMSTLYLIHQEAKLKREHLRFIIETDKDVVDEIPIRDVERVLVFGNVQLTNAVISTCLESQIPIVFLSQMGQYKGHLWSAELCDLEAQAAQFRLRDDEEFQLGMARAIVFGKLMNSKQLLLRLNRKRNLDAVREAILGIAADIDSVATAETTQSLFGYEGVAAARYFPALGQLLVAPDFSLTTRTRRPPKDPVNSMLSFGYTLLFNNVLSLILAEGLNPYLGNFHGSDRRNPHLAFDLMEEFRSPVVDSMVMTLVNKKAIKPTDFTWFTEDGGVYLTDLARRVFLKYFEDRMSDLVTHGDLESKVSYRRAIQLQVQRYKRCLLDAVPYEAFLRAV